MRRKTFDLLFETTRGMSIIGQERCLWRSLWYFTLSLGLFGGVVTNHFYAAQTLGFRAGLIISGVLIAAVALCIYGFVLHGIVETLGNSGGDPKALICLLGYTALPFLVLTPVALLSTKIGYGGVLLFACIVAVGLLWMLYLLMYVLQMVYIIDFARAAAVVLFSLLLLYIITLLPLQLFFKLLMVQLGL